MLSPDALALKAAARARKQADKQADLGRDMKRLDGAHSAPRSGAGFIRDHRTDATAAAADNDGPGVGAAAMLGGFASALGKGWGEATAPGAPGGAGGAPDGKKSPGGLWLDVVDSASRKHYFVNAESGETSWTKPNGRVVTSSLGGGRGFVLGGGIATGAGVPGTMPRAVVVAPKAPTWFRSMDSVVPRGGGKAPGTQI